MLAKNGFSIRFDHRTLKAQREEAERNGDTFLARLFSRVPEEYVGVISCQEEDSPQLERLREFRALRKQHFDLVMKLEALLTEAEELETKDAVQQSSTKARGFIAEPKNLTQYQQECRAKMFTAVAEVHKWKRVVISYRDAREQAKLEYMSKAERELWQKYFETLAQKKQLEEFLKTLHKPDDSQKPAVKAYEEVVAGVRAKISALSTAAVMMSKTVEEISQRLDSPEYRNNILLVTHQILQSNVQARKMLKRANDDLEKSVEELQNAVCQLEEVEARAKQLAERMSHTKVQVEALKLRLKLDKPSTLYKIITPDNSTNNSAVSIIADAILNEPKAVQLVARSIGNNLEMERTWELMSEIDKDEFIQKKIIRDL